MLTPVLTLLIGAPVPPPLQEAMTPPQPAVEVATYHVVMEQPEVTWKAIIDPREPEGNRITVISPPKTVWPKGSAKGLAAYDADADGNIWCDSIDEMVGESITEEYRSTTDISYMFSLRQKDEATKADLKFAEAARGRVLLMRDGLGPWRVSHIQVWLEDSFKPNFAARISDLDIEITCAPTPDGRMYQAQTTTRIAGSAMGRHFDKTERVDITSVELAPTAE